MSFMQRKSGLLKAMAVALSIALPTVLAVSAADARIGGGSSSGSRGTRTFSAPPPTTTAPGSASQFNRTITQPGQPGGFNTAAPARGGLFGGRFGGMLGGLAAGFLGAGLFGTVVALLALVIMQRETRPLVRLAAAVDRVDPAGARVPLPDIRRNAPEVRAVVTAFGRLQDRLAELIQARMALVGGIAHDVRTFATRLRLRVDQIPDDAERQRAVVDISDMIRLLDDALVASRAGAGELPQELIAFDEVVRAEIDDRRNQHAPVRLDRAGESGELLLLGDRLALRRIIANLIDNALKYGRVADVALRTEAAHAVLIVDDQGPGIPPDKRNAMLEPFTRMDMSRNRSTGGAGLGLAVVRTLVEAHGGSIEIADAPRGARIIVRLPLFQDSADGQSHA